MAALPAHLTATGILMPEEDRASMERGARNRCVFDPLTLEGMLPYVTQVKHRLTETLTASTVQEGYLPPPPKRWSSETEVPNPRILSRTPGLTFGVTSQVEFLSDQDFAVRQRFTSVQPSTLAPLVKRILRKHFLDEVLIQLSNLAKFARSELAANYANRLFRSMRLVRDRLPEDPFSAVILALHDALAFENNWVRYTSEQYARAREILIRFGNQDLHEDKALKAVAALEDIGFDTTPFRAPDEGNDAA